MSVRVFVRVVVCLCAVLQCLCGCAVVKVCVNVFVFVCSFARMCLAARWIDCLIDGLHDCLLCWLCAHVCLRV